MSKGHVRHRNVRAKRWYAQWLCRELPTKNLVGCLPNAETDGTVSGNKKLDGNSNGIFFAGKMNGKPERNWKTVKTAGHRSRETKSEKLKL